ncbi:thiol:disulfide interchange protein, putative [Vulcanisaeta moutnovskia 768-28]|uniref:Thiol:disulfide interchange protein, putative n=1 Tax=Vulcanisaeta moutnovskia (strain 768-28) TaxID=985053 RepID=F0QV34_VULM7|nr:thioredoxin domain-containing protein [Vulcanisaeta moutnovskia]ADY00766.1 thiol:disulfide interchange protein, putative [Vulcanisaeta moutnovskia 768-28]
MSDEWLIKDIRRVLEKVEGVGLGFRAQSSRLLIVIFYDLYCPGCALLEDEAGDYLLELFREGKASLYFVDYPVHRGVEKFHAAFRCIYKRDPLIFLEVLKRHYEAYLSGKLKGEETITGASNDCINEELQRVMEAKSIAKELGAPGTPTIIIGNLVKNIGQGVFGYPGLMKFMKIIEELYIY